MFYLGILTACTLPVTVIVTSEDVDGIAVVTSCVKEGLNDPSKPIATAAGQGKLSITNGTEACLNATGNQNKIFTFSNQAFNAPRVSQTF